MDFSMFKRCFPGFPGLPGLGEAGKAGLYTFKRVAHAMSLLGWA
jgi:hypothetical protein